MSKNSKAVSNQQTTLVDRNTITKGVLKTLNGQPPKEEAEKESRNVFDVFAQYFKEQGIKRNEVSKYFDRNEEQLEEEDINSIFVDIYKECAGEIKRGLSGENFKIFLKSNKVARYHPIKEYFDALPEVLGTKNIDALVSTLQLKAEKYFLIKDETETAYSSQDLLKVLVKRWLVGMVATIYDKEGFNLLMPVLIGADNIGKTEFFKRLLPQPLRAKKLFDELRFDTGKDHQAIMCQKFLICNGELAGMDKKEAAEFRDHISKPYYTYRPPYGRQNSTFKRTASMCGTSNPKEVIADPQFNRRIIPIEINSIDQNAYNAINKNELWAEVFTLYNNKHEWDLTQYEVYQLKAFAVGYAVISPERELIITHFKPAEKGAPGSVALQAVQILNEICSKTSPGVRLNKIKLGRELAALHFISRSERVKECNNEPRYVYDVIRLTNTINGEQWP